MAITNGPWAQQVACPILVSFLVVSCRVVKCEVGRLGWQSPMLVLERSITTTSNKWLRADHGDGSPKSH